MAEPLVLSGQLFHVVDSPEFIHPAYVVYPRETDNAALTQALKGLREACRIPDTNA